MPSRFIAKPAERLGLRQGYLKVPAFSVITGTWRGASEVFKQYNFSAEKSFVLPHIPKQLDNLNYALTIKYRTGSNIYRYKLWDKLNLLPQVEPYVNQIIKPNFCLEFWSFEGLSETVISEKIFQLGLKVPPTDLRKRTGVQVTTDAQEAILDTEMLVELDTDNMSFWYVGDDIPDNDISEPSSWPSHDSGFGNTLQLIGAAPYNKDFFSFDYTQFYVGTLEDANEGLRSLNTAQKYNTHLYLVLRSSGPLVKAYADDNETLNFILGSVDNMLNLSINWAGVVLDKEIDTDITKFHLFALTSSVEYYNNNPYQRYRVRVYRMSDGVLLADYNSLRNTQGQVSYTGPFSFGKYPYNTVISFAEMLGYSNVNLNQEIDELTIKYLIQKYYKGLHLHFPELHPSVAWKDNLEETPALALEYKDLSIKPADAFKDVIYLRNTNDGKYYPVTLTTVNGITTVNIGNSPVEV